MDKCFDPPYPRSSCEPHTSQKRTSHKLTHLYRPALTVNPFPSIDLIDWSLSSPSEGKEAEGTDEAGVEMGRVTRGSPTHWIWSLEFGIVIRVGFPLYMDITSREWIPAECGETKNYYRQSSKSFVQKTACKIKFGIKRVDKGEISTVKRKQSWSFER